MLFRIHGGEYFTSTRGIASLGKWMAGRNIVSSIKTLLGNTHVGDAIF